MRERTRSPTKPRRMGRQPAYLMLTEATIKDPMVAHVTLHSQLNRFLVLPAWQGRALSAAP
jgi:hypothetical protein